MPTVMNRQHIACTQRERPMTPEACRQPIASLAAQREGRALVLDLLPAGQIPFN